MPHTTFEAGGRLQILDAIEYAKSWRLIDDLRKLNYVGDIKAFFIPKDDIDDVYAIMNSVGGAGCRAYFGVDLLNQTIRFMIVPTDANETDLCQNLVTGESQIFDFTRPCPTQCDTGSILYSERNYHAEVEPQATDAHEAAETHHA